MHTKQILKASYPASIPSRDRASRTMFSQRITRNNVVWFRDKRNRTKHQEIKNMLAIPFIEQLPKEHLL